MFLASKVPDSYEASSLILFCSVIIASSSLFFASERLQKFQTAMKLSGLLLFRSPDECLEFSRATFDSSSSSLLFASERLQKFQTTMKLSVVNCHDECLEFSRVITNSSSSSLFLALERLQKFQTAMKLSGLILFRARTNALNFLASSPIPRPHHCSSASKVSDSYETIRPPMFRSPD